MIEHEIEVPLVYYFSYLETRRHSKPVNGIGVETLKVKIREADLAEVPVAARHKVSSAPGGKETFRIGPDGFYTEVHASRYSGRPSQYLIAQELREFSEQGQTYCNALFEDMERSAYERFQRGEAINPESVAIIKTSGREKALETLTANAANLLVMDGAVWRRVEMPVYYVTQGGGFLSTPYVDIEIGDKSKFADKPQERIFPLNQFDEAKAYALSHFNGEVDHAQRAEIFIREAFNYDDVTPATLELLSRSMEEHRKDIGYSDKETATIWFDFRDATTKALATKQEADIEAAIECGKLYRARPEAYERAAKLLDEAAMRWEDRMMTSGMKI
jgi:hypothetical protein